MKSFKLVDSVKNRIGISIHTTPLNPPSTLSTRGIAKAFLLEIEDDLFGFSHPNETNQIQDDGVVNDQLPQPVTKHILPLNVEPQPKVS
jgi:hypothetical protein